MIATGRHARASASSGTARKHPIRRRSSGTIAPNSIAMPTTWAVFTSGYSQIEARSVCDSALACSAAAHGSIIAPAFAACESVPVGIEIVSLAADDDALGLEHALLRIGVPMP